MRFLLTLAIAVTLAGCASATSPSPRHVAGEPASGDPTLEPTTTTPPGLAMITIPLGGGPYKIVFYEGHQCKACENLVRSSEHIGTFDANGERVLFIPQARSQTRYGKVMKVPWDNAAGLGASGAAFEDDFVGPPLPDSQK